MTISKKKSILIVSYLEEATNTIKFRLWLMHFDHFGICIETFTMSLMQLLYAPSSMDLLDFIRKYIKSRNLRQMIR